MTNPRPRNIAASIHERLLDKSKEHAQPFNELFQYYAIDILYRLSRSSHAGKFILKGALTLLVWGARTSRSTMDVDMLGRMKNTPEAVIDMVRRYSSGGGAGWDCFRSGGESGSPKTPTTKGCASASEGCLITRGSPSVDVGFGDVVFPSPKLMTYPTNSICRRRVRGYSRESSIGEVRGDGDFWDIRLLSRQFDFDGKTLTAAIAETFSKRHTDVPANPRLYRYLHEGRNENDPMEGLPS